MTTTAGERNVATAKLLVDDAMPNGEFDLVGSLVTADAPIKRAGFADLYALTGDAIPQEGNFVQWLEAGWKALSASLTDQTSETVDIVGDEHSVVLHFRMIALRSGTFAGAPATGNRVGWDEIGVLHFGEDGKITDLWFMCQELSLARQIGYTPTLR